MLFRVAGLLGRTVEELLDTMSGEEFMGWCAFYHLEPWGYEAANWRMAVVAATTANYSNRKLKKPLKPSDFLPSDKPRRRQLSDAELRARLQSDIDKASRK
jgi:hypothetical protein